MLTSSPTRGGIFCFPVRPESPKTAFRRAATAESEEKSAVDSVEIQPGVRGLVVCENFAISERGVKMCTWFCENTQWVFLSRSLTRH